LPDNGQPTELVRGRIVPLNMPYPRHGEICGKLIRLVGNFVEDHQLGRVVSNDSGVLTESDPDTVRGADLAFYSFDRIPPGPLPQGYLAVVPELIFEVRSPSDRWARVHTKIAEYLNAGVSVVCVLDERTQSAHIFPADEPNRIVTADEELTFPELLPDFRVVVRRFFE
jgi:Uma2 family endonuclease